MRYTGVVEPTLLERYQQRFEEIVEVTDELIRNNQLKTLQENIHNFNAIGNVCKQKDTLLLQIKQVLYSSNNQKQTRSYSIIPVCAVAGCFTSGSFAGFLCGVLMEKHILQATLTTCPLVIVTAAVAGLLIGALIGLIVAKQQHIHTSKSVPALIFKKPRDNARDIQKFTR